MRLLPITTNGAGYKIIADALNNNIDQVCIFFNNMRAISPVTIEEIPRIMQLRNMIGVNILNDSDVVCSVGGFYDYEPFGNRLNGKMWVVSTKDHFKIYNQIIEKLIDWGFKSCGLHKITVELRSDVSPLAKCLIYYGFEKEGELMEQVRLHGKWCSVKVYGKIFKIETETIQESESVPAEEIKKISTKELLEMLNLTE